MDIQCLQYGNANEQLKLPSYKQYHGMVDAFKKVYKHEGFTGLYKGFVPGKLNAMIITHSYNYLMIGILGVSHGALQFMAYEDLKRRYTERYNLPPECKLGTTEYLTFAALSKLFAATITYPYQVLRARLQDQHNSYTGLLDVMRKTWR